MDGRDSKKFKYKTVYSANGLDKNTENIGQIRKKVFKSRTKNNYKKFE